MKRNKLPSQDTLKKMFDYDPLTGSFKHKPRDADDNRTKAWNICYAGQVAGTQRPQSLYWAIKIDGFEYKIHRLIWMYYHGEDPGDKVIDHINLKPWDNRISNLRLATHSENLCNSPQYKTYKGQKVRRPYKGVQFITENVWCAQIQKDNKNYNLGRFKTAEEAQLAYQEAAKKLHKNYIYSLSTEL